VSVELAGRMKLELPYLVNGFDDAPEQVREAVEHGVRENGVAYLGRSRMDAATSWIQLAVAGIDQPDPDAAGVVYVCERGFHPFQPRRAHPQQMLGLVAGSADLAQAIPFALEQGMDLLLLSAMQPITRPWAELHGQPDFTVLRDAVRLMRQMNREEDIDLLYFGGIRSGTDVAKVVALGCKAVVVAAGMGFATGGVVQGGGLHFYSDVGDEQRRDRAASYLRALREECSIMARCTGKTNVQNLEPEDVRAITITTSRATGVPLVGLNKVPEAA
jgi:glutamate synthase (NADPH/NADH) large chain